jgi:uncharacterized protein YdiU (UPF0061 family)
MSCNPFRFEHTYAGLPAGFHSVVQPTPVHSPRLLLLNEALAAELGIHTAGCGESDWANMLSGNAMPPGSQPLAQAYAGHQFGHFTMLGDGRALLLGEHRTPTGQLFDIQLKGSGPTPYARRGDGRAALGPMLREYIISEAMHALGIPTSRSLVVVATGEPVMREQVLPGAVLTRVMDSHLRVGHFEYASHFLGTNDLETLVHYALQRHYPQVAPEESPALTLLQEVAKRQTELVVEWMRVGFIHGVMNTDNMSMAGLTFDYGPCAFMNAYHPGTVFSSIDRQGRYAFAMQPGIVQWNLVCLANALIPLIHENVDHAVILARQVIDAYPDRFADAWLSMMRRKLGLTGEQPGDKALADELLHWMQQHRADYTHTFLQLMDVMPEGVLQLTPSFVAWKEKYNKRQQEQEGGREAGLALMRNANPVYIPRNHRVEAALEAAQVHADLKPVQQLLEVLRSPYAMQSGRDEFLHGPEGGDAGYQTFCGT